MVTSSTLRPTLVVEIRLLPPEAGGRTLPVISGYRPIFKLQRRDKEELMVGLSELVVPDGTSIEPGGSGRAIVLTAPQARDILVENIGVGDYVQLCEGTHVVGEAKVVELLG
jgi:hypothetical protein